MDSGEPAVYDYHFAGPWTILFWTLPSLEVTPSVAGENIWASCAIKHQVLFFTQFNAMVFVRYFMYRLNRREAWQRAHPGEKPQI